MLTMQVKSFINDDKLKVKKQGTWDNRQAGGHAWGRQDFPYVKASQFLKKTRYEVVEAFF